VNTFESIVFASPVERKCPFCVTEEDRIRWEEEDKKKAEEEAKKKAEEEEAKKKAELEEETNKKTAELEDEEKKKVATETQAKEGGHGSEANAQLSEGTKMDIEKTQ